MVTIKASYQPNNKNHTTITIIINHKKITLKPIIKIQINVRLIKKITYLNRRDIKKKRVVSLK